MVIQAGRYKTKDQSNKRELLTPDISSTWQEEGGWGSRAPSRIDLFQGRKSKPAPEKIASPKEHVLHIATADLLRDHCLPDWRWFHPANGEHRDIRTAAKLKAMGVKPGIPDFVLVSPMRMPHFLEIKREGGVLNRDQEAFRLWCVKVGVPHAVAWTTDQVLSALDAWKCLRIELKTRSAAERG